MELLGSEENHQRKQHIKNIITGLSGIFWGFCLCWGHPPNLFMFSCFFFPELRSGWGMESTVAFFWRMNSRELLQTCFVQYICVGLSLFTSQFLFDILWEALRADSCSRLCDQTDMCTEWWSRDFSHVFIHPMGVRFPGFPLSHSQFLFFFRRGLLLYVPSTDLFDIQKSGWDMSIPEVSRLLLCSQFFVWLYACECVCVCVWVQIFASYLVHSFCLILCNQTATWTEWWLYQEFPKRSFCEGAEISINGVARAPVTITNFASNPCENLWVYILNLTRSARTKTTESIIAIGARVTPIIETPPPTKKRKPLETDFCAMFGALKSRVFPQTSSCPFTIVRLPFLHSHSLFDIDAYQTDRWRASYVYCVDAQNSCTIYRSSSCPFYWC